MVSSAIRSISRAFSAGTWKSFADAGMGSVCSEAEEEEEEAIAIAVGERRQSLDLDALRRRLSLRLGRSGEAGDRNRAMPFPLSFHVPPLPTYQ